MPEDAATAAEVRDDPERSRYELLLDGEVAVVADYRREGGRVSFTHTGTEPRLRGRGLAGQLIERALAEAKEAGDEVLPYCSFVSDYIADHPEYLELVPAEQRGEFGLPSAGGRAPS
jgi:predicted GNAT family acetyltransferase